MALTVAAVLAWRRRCPTIAGILITAAVATKLWPLAIGLFLLFAFGGRQRVRYAAAAVVAGVVALTVLETYLYGSLVRLHPRAEVAVIVRNLCLLVLVLVTAVRLSRAERVTSHAPAALPA